MNFFMEIAQQPNSSKVLCIALETVCLTKRNFSHNQHNMQKPLSASKKVDEGLKQGKIKKYDCFTSHLKVCVCVCLCVASHSFKGMLCMNFHQSKAAFEVLWSLSICSFFYNVSYGESEHEVGHSQFDLRNLVVSKDLNGLRM